MIFNYDPSLEGYLTDKEKAMLELLFSAGYLDKMVEFLEDDPGDIVVRVRWNNSGKLIVLEVNNLVLWRAGMIFLRKVCEKFTVADVEIMVSLLGWDETWKGLWETV